MVYLEIRDGQCDVSAGTYSIGDWPRATKVWEAPDALAALDALEVLATRAEAVPVDPKPCRSCGTESGVTLDPDPYQHDINGDATPVWMCDGCREQSAADI